MQAEFPRLAKSSTQTEALWKALITSGNSAYADGNIQLARTLYEQALSEAERLFDNAPSPKVTIPAPVLYNISCHNLAALLAAEGESVQAIGYYQRAYDRLMGAAATPHLPFSLRLSCAQHLLPALSPLIESLRAHHCPEEQIRILVRDAHHQAGAIFRILHLKTPLPAACSHYPALPS